MAPSPLARIRAICLALPGSHEVEAWGEPTFRVKNKLFAMYADSGNHHGAGRPAVWVKCTHVNQDLLIRSDETSFYSPPYVGPSGWIGVFLDKQPDWEAIAEIVGDGYRMIAPKRMMARHADEVRSPPGSKRASKRTKKN